MADFNSELSANGAPYQEAMTLALFAVGTLIILYSVGMARWVRPSSAGLWGSLVLALTGLAFILIGVFPCDPGCSLQAPSSTMKAHMLAGFGGMILQTIAMVIFGFYGRRHGEDLRIGKVSKILGAIAVLSMAWLYGAYFGLAHMLPNPVIAQKIWTLASDIWLISCASLMIRTNLERSALRAR